MTKFERVCLENVPPYAVIACVFLATVLFLIRDPVIIVSDDMFTSIYGAKREHYSAIEMSARLFRKIKILRMAIDAKSEAVTFAVEDASKHPAFVVFPARYSNAVERYVKDYPKTKCFLIADLSRKTENINGVQIIKTGIDVDYHRAGLFAALSTSLPILNSETQKYGSDIGKTILYFPQEDEDDPLNKIFHNAVRKKTSDAAIIDFNRDSTDLSRMYKVCVFLNSSSTGLLRQNTNFNAKIITKSWIDPLYTPPNTIIIFNDSAIALLPALSKLRLRKTLDVPIKIPSSITVMTLRIPSKKLLLSLATVMFSKP